jgi:YD repeat-containing protein
VTDPDGFAAKIEYSFHTGLVMRSEDPKGAQQTFTYDAAGRAVRVERSGKDETTQQLVNGGYTRWVYGDAMDAVQSWTKVDAGMPEVCSISILDGGGRARATASDFPGSTGGYRAQYTAYDIAGRATGQTNPTEVNGLWNPSGDDAAAGWKWTTQTFDWKSRPLVTTLPKLLSPSDPGYASEQPVTREVSYDGCGCAGGEAVTIKGEVVPTNEPSRAGRRESAMTRSAAPCCPKSSSGTEPSTRRRRRSTTRSTCLCACGSTRARPRPRSPRARAATTTPR